MSNAQHNKQHYTRITHHPTNQHEPTITSHNTNQHSKQHSDTRNITTTSTHNDKRNSPHSGWMNTPTHHNTPMFPWSPVIFLFFFIPPSYDTIPLFVFGFLCFCDFVSFCAALYCFLFFVFWLFCFQLSKYFHTITYHHFVLGFWGGFCTRIPRFFLCFQLVYHALVCFVVP